MPNTIKQPLFVILGKKKLEDVHFQSCFLLLSYRMEEVMGQPVELEVPSWKLTMFVRRMPELTFVRRVTTSEPFQLTKSSSKFYVRSIFWMTDPFLFYYVRYVRILHTDLGSRIGDFDCGYSVIFLPLYFT